MARYVIAAGSIVLALALAEPTAAQQIRAGLLTCDVSAGIGLIITSRKQVSCTFNPDQPGRQEDYDGTITNYGLDLGVTGGGVMMWRCSPIRSPARVSSPATMSVPAERQALGQASAPMF